VGPAFIFLCCKRSTPSLSAKPAQYFLSLGHSSDSGQTNNFEVEKQVIILGARPGLYGGCMKISHLNCLHPYFVLCYAHYSCLLWTTNTIFSHSFRWLHLHHTLQQSDCEFLPDKHFLVFKNHITHRTLQVAGISVFMFIFNNCCEWEEKLWHRTTQYRCSRWHTEDSWPSQEVCTSPVRPLSFVIASYFLDAPYKYYSLF
jgi:hypothetical protein